MCRKVISQSMLIGDFCVQLLIMFFIFSIEGDWVPKEGDEVTYKRSLVPPKNEKYAAVHVQIIHQVAGIQHEKWDKEALLKPVINEVDS